MKKRSFLLVSLVLSAPFAYAGEGRTLKCGDMTISGVGTATIVLKDGSLPDFTVPREMNGDCTNRVGKACYEVGQLMVNIAADLSNGRANEGTVWVNEDTDDRPENHRLGDTHTCSAVEPVMPKSLRCSGVQFLKGFKNFSAISDYFPMRLNPISGRSAVLASACGNHGGSEGAVSLKKGIVTIDFSEGDQYSFYKFRASDLLALALGRVKRVAGTYEDGFDWTDGYNTRARFSVVCRQ